MFMSLTHLGAALLRRAAIILLMLAAAALAAPAQAQTTTLAARQGPVTVAVMGDSVAHDLGRGMEDLFAKDHHIRVIRKTKFATGLVRTDYYDWNKVARDFLRRHKPDAIFIMLGGNDHQTIRRHGKRYDPDTKAWRAEYARLVSRFMDNFSSKHTNAKVYWVSLPPVRSTRLSAAFRTINAIDRYEAKKHDLHTIDIWKNFLDADGHYTSFGDTLNGVKRRLRMQDGQHFTEAGRLVLARDVARAAGLR